MSLIRAADGFLAAETTTIEDGRQSEKIVYGREAIEVLFEEAREAFENNRGEAKLLNDFSTFS